CGRFLDSGIPLGNIYNQKLSHSLTNSPWRLNLFKRQEMLHNGHCSGCELWKYCKGGCPYFSELYYSDSLQASPFCETTKIFFERTILNSLQTSGETIK
ncbi:MAG: SPASM domain-containing protein, partial [Thermodesulfovibrionia bacterium]|nr:SPASM domain-containing protein [Thermodesulfovibrionia bacterium]